MTRVHCLATTISCLRGNADVSYFRRANSISENIVIKTAFLLLDVGAFTGLGGIQEDVSAKKSVVNCP